MPGHPVGCRSRPTGQRGADHQLGLRLWSHEIAGECRDLSAARAGVDAVAGFFVSAPAANMRLTRNKNGGRPFDSGLPHFYHRGVKTPENYHEFVRTIAIPPDCDILCVCRLFHAFLPRLEGASGRRGRRFKSCHPDFSQKEALRRERRRAFSLWGQELRHRARSSKTRFRAIGASRRSRR
jgi:hypothetical protein